MLEMDVKCLMLDPFTNMPIVILKDKEGKRALPIWVGIFEANAIALEIEKVSTPRPMTHDLIKNVLETLQAKVNHILINDLKDNTFYAVISLTVDGSQLLVDSRPSDAIALALRVSAPIFVSREVVEEARSIDLSEEKQEDDTVKWREWLENLRPEDFGTLHEEG